MQVIICGSSFFENLVSSLVISRHILACFSLSYPTKIYKLLTTIFVFNVVRTVACHAIKSTRQKLILTVLSWLR